MRSKPEAEKRDLIAKIQFSMKNLSMSESCKMHNVPQPSYKMWCLELGIPMKQIEQVTVIQGRPQNPIELCKQLLPIVSSCLIIAELPDGETIHVKMKGDREQIKYLLCIADLEIDRRFEDAETEEKSSIDLQAKQIRETIASHPDTQPLT